MSSKTVPLTIRHAQGAKNILASDRARLQKLKAGLHPHGPLAFKTRRDRRARHKDALEDDGELEEDSGAGRIYVDQAGPTYLMSVGVGDPPTQYSLCVDTGSSNTWIGADKEYVLTDTSVNTEKGVSVAYGSGEFSGTEYLDTVYLGPELRIDKQSIGVASRAKGFDDCDGILGIGPVDLTSDTVAGLSVVPTVIENLFDQGTINSQTIGISFNPTTVPGVEDGGLSFGEVDPSKFTGEINYVPITSTSPASNYWGVDQTITYGDGIEIMALSAGIVDTGTSFSYIPTDAFEAYKEATGAIEDEETSLLTVTEEQYEKLQSLFFKIGDVTYEFTRNAQIWPRSLNHILGGNSDAIYLITCDEQTESGSGLDFTNGFVFLQRFYSVYDTDNSQIGFATTEYTDAETN